TPAASTRTRISFASNSGTGSSRIFISFKPPNRSIATVFIVLFRVRFIERPPIGSLTFGKSGGYIREKGDPTFRRPFLCLRKLRTNRDQGFYSIHAGQQNVHERNIGLVLAVLLNLFRSAGCLRPQPHIRLVVDDSCDAITKEVMTVSP